MNWCSMPQPQVAARRASARDSSGGNMQLLPHYESCGHRGALPAPLSNVCSSRSWSTQRGLWRCTSIQLRPPSWPCPTPHHAEEARPGGSRGRMYGQPLHCMCIMHLPTSGASYNNAIPDPLLTLPAPSIRWGFASGPAAAAASARQAAPAAASCHPIVDSPAPATRRQAATPKKKAGPA